MGGDDKILLYVAIDFGTTFSGYAFRFKQQKDIQVCKSLGGESLGFQSYKVPTCVLTDSADNFLAFGYEAQDKFSENDEDNDDDESDKDDGGDRVQHTLHFYDEFKMKLAGEKKFNRNMKLKAYGGHECSALKIFAMVLTYLKTHLLKEIQKQANTVPNTDEIKWILTVPAIWSDSAKQFMRESAIEAGIVSKNTEEQLLIALEPEAASLFCRQLDFGDFNLKEAVKSSVNKLGHEKGLPPNSQYMVVDCGGGTVDVTAHHYKKKGEICELYSASGGGWGGRNVNKEYEKILNEVLGDNIMETFKETKQAAYLQDKVKFEKEKRSIDFKKSTNGQHSGQEKQKEVKYSFSCGHEFIKLCIQMNENKKIESIVKSKSKHGITFSAGFLRFPQEALVRIFSPSIEQIKHHILELIKKDALKDLQYIYLVGGFSDCSLLQKVIQDEFKSGRHKDKTIQVILAPYEASLAVMKGAVLFGENPQAISSRCSRRFYCTSKSTSKGPAQMSGKSKRALKQIVSQNEEIHNDDVRHVHFFPYYEGKVFKLYHYKVYDGDAEPRSTVKFTTDKGAIEIEIDCSDIIGANCSADTKISVFLYFDSTEIHVTARNDTSPNQKQVKMSIDCLEH